MFVPLVKISEPPPPKGVSVTEWDKYLEGKADSMRKKASELTQTGRERIKGKNFAIPKGNGPGETGKYPIHDEAHARNALTRVRQFGTPSERSKVYNAVAKKYPGLAARSSIESVQKKASAPPLNLIRKIASQNAFEEVLRPPVIRAENSLLVNKLASVSDPEVYQVASALGGDAHEVMARYERLGGRFEKLGFGAPMFNTQQMAGSPAVGGAMKPPTMQAPGAATPSMKPPTMPSPQPQQPQQGGTPMTTTTTTKQVVAPAAPAAPTSPTAGGQSSA